MVSNGFVYLTMADKVGRERIAVDVGDLRNLLEQETQISGNSLSQEVRLLIQEGLKQRYKQRTLAQVLSLFDVEQLAKDSGICAPRLAELIVEADAPTNLELTKLGRCLPLNAVELASISRKPAKKDY
ncbi:hypothetical protein [Microseira wollei]|uniref:Ribbon-helix-helix protein CopG domain-containing protein n=1 Tax=Microseira wollei NIES-4236 TaxID=2530354 RepID=A0AAV3XR73_9CYAN|nr:hypothetical protein [Microseira wollei]GET42820.1 hypothetical protein MiSe_76380 [Microseira wollei NIES-4236]